MIGHTSDVHSVSRLHFVHQVIVRVDDCGVWRLTRRHVLGRFLQFDLSKNMKI